MSRLWAFIRRDLQISLSYKLNAALAAVGGLMTLTVLYFLARTMGDLPGLRSRYGAGYFSFSLVGVAVAMSLRAFQTSFARALREAQTDGSLEALFAAPLSTLEVVGCLAAYPLAAAVAAAAALVLAGQVLFGAQLSLHPLAFALTLALAALPFAALGLLSASFVLVFKRGDPFAYALDVAAYLLSGILYPREVLPPPLQALSRLLPSTYAVEALRAAALLRAPPGALLHAWAALALFGALLWPLAAGALTLARRHVERMGTLPQA